MEIRPERIIGSSYLLLADEHWRREKLKLPYLGGSGAQVCLILSLK